MSPGALKTYRAREVTERIRDELRVSTLRRLEKSEEAETEADAVYDAFLRCLPAVGRQPAGQCLRGALTGRRAVFQHLDRLITSGCRASTTCTCSLRFLVLVTVV